MKKSWNFVSSEGWERRMWVIPSHPCAGFNRTYLIRLNCRIRVITPAHMSDLTIHTLVSHKDRPAWPCATSEIIDYTRFGLFPLKLTILTCFGQFSFLAYPTLNGNIDHILCSIRVIPPYIGSPTYVITSCRHR